MKNQKSYIFHGYQMW